MELADILYENDFDTQPEGPLTAAALASSWRSPPWSNGVGEGRVRITRDPENAAGRVLSVQYLKGKIGPKDGGAEWFMPLGRRADDLYIAYRLRFEVGFDFVKGGKLPGLGGGANNTGGHKPNGTDGFSARMMWRTGGHAVQYVYHPDQPGTYGEDFAWMIGGEPVVFVPGRWYHVEHRILMNTPGQKDGLIQAWLDGALVLEKRGLRFRTTSAYAIDTLQFSTFFGGGDPSWAATRDEVIAFDDFIVASRPITH